MNWNEIVERVSPNIVKIETPKGHGTGFWCYWPTTVRVDANMDTFWLPDEERTCQSYPDNNGRVSLVNSYRDDAWTVTISERG